MNNKDLSRNNRKATNSSPSARRLSRRQFMVTGGAAASAIAIVPRHVLGGPGFVAPQREDHAGVRWVWHTGDSGNRRHSRQARGASGRHVRRGEERSQLP
jgi:hypothetical protein